MRESRSSRLTQAGLVRNVESESYFATKVGIENRKQISEFGAVRNLLRRLSPKGWSSNGTEVADRKPRFRSNSKTRQEPHGLSGVAGFRLSRWPASDDWRKPLTRGLRTMMRSDRVELSVEEILRATATIFNHLSDESVSNRSRCETSIYFTVLSFLLTPQESA